MKIFSISGLAVKFVAYKSYHKSKTKDVIDTKIGLELNNICEKLWYQKIVMVTSWQKASTIWLIFWFLPNSKLTG